MKTEFETTDLFGNKIILSKENYEHILLRPEMGGQEERIKETLKSPDVIKFSKYDKQKWLYYRFYDRTPVSKKYLLVIVKMLPKEKFIVTSFYTDKIKAGEIVWQK